MPAAPDAYRLRLCSEYEVVPAERLSAPERSLIDERLASDLGGLLRPRSPRRTVRAISRDALTELCRLDGDAAQVAVPLEPQVARLVLDGVVELATPNGWLSGPAAAPLVPLPDACDDVADGRLVRVSMAALRYGTYLEGLSIPEMARRLYCYGRLPLTPRRALGLPVRPVVRDAIDGGPLSAAHAALRDGWNAVEPRPDNDRWRIFVNPLGGERLGADALPYKLYVSPWPDELGAVFRVVVDAFTRLGVPCFKVADDLAGMLRPDKLVAYFPTRERLDEAADGLASSLESHRPHGVPFTAEIALDGLLSWAVDPPHGSGAESWRAWVTLRASSAVIAAQTLGACEPAWRYALRRLMLDGVDVRTWTPDAQRASRSAWDW